MKHHTDLNQCILDAIDFEDNCNDVSRTSGRTENDARSTRDANNQVDEIAKGVIEKMQQLFGPIRDRTKTEDRIDNLCVDNVVGIILLHNVYQSRTIRKRADQLYGVNLINVGETTPHKNATIASDS